MIKLEGPGEEINSSIFSASSEDFKILYPLSFYFYFSFYFSLSLSLSLKNY